MFSRLICLTCSSKPADLRWWLVGTTHILALDVGFLVLTSTLSSSIHDVEDDVQEQLLNTHSEKLAISFGLLNTKPGTTIHIKKNLRVCADCHNATMFISLVTK